MNIGIFTDTFFPQINGVVTSTQMLEKELIKRDHNVYIFTTTDPDSVKETEPDRIFRLPSMPFVFFPSRRITFVYPPKVLLSLKHLKLDVVHTQTEFPLGFFGKVVSEFYQIPFVHTYHTMYEDYVHYVGNGHLITPKMAQGFSKFFCNRADCVVTPVEKSKSSLIEYGVKRPIRVIPTGLDFCHFKKNNFPKKDIEDLKLSLGLNLNEPVILSLGRISKEKSIDVIVKFMPDLIKKIPNVKLVIVGDGPMLEELKAITNNLNLNNNILFTGIIPWDIIGKYYQLADVFVSASESETQGLTYIEAILSKIPLLVKRDDSLEGVITHRETGFLFENKDDFVDLCVDLLNNKEKAKNMAEEAYNSIQHLSSKQFATNMESLYLDIIDNYNYKKSIRKNLKKIKEKVKLKRYVKAE